MIYILSADVLFRSMLKTELEAERMDCDVLDTVTKKQLGSNILLIDLDTCPEVPDFCKFAIGWARDNQSVPSASLDKCFCVLHRPFRISEICRQINLLTAEKNNQPISDTDGGKFPILLADRSSCEYHDTQIQLTPAEYSVLELLLAKAGVTVENAEICRLIGANPNTLRVFMFNIRTKLSAVSETPLIKTVKGLGYRINK